MKDMFEFHGLNLGPFMCSWRGKKEKKVLPLMLNAEDHFSCGDQNWKQLSFAALTMKETKIHPPTYPFIKLNFVLKKKNKEIKKNCLLV